MEAITDPIPTPCVFIVYTDGSFIAEGIAGVGIYIRQARIAGQHQTAGIPISNTISSHETELAAICEALKRLPENAVVTLFCDDREIVRKLRKGLRGKSSWWVELYELIRDRIVHWCYVKGHAGNPSNKLVDKLAKQAARTNRIFDSHAMA